MGPSLDQAKRHVVTVNMEDYFHVGAFNRLIQRGQWYRFERGLERGTRRAMDLLDEFGVRATFFALGWVGDNMPELIQEVAARGHDVASKGYYHRSIRQMTPEEFREDLVRSREALEGASGRRVLGHRVAHEWFNLTDLWALDVLAEEGFEYDSSLGPVFRSCAAQPWRRFLHAHEFGTRMLWEFPMSSVSLAGWSIPIAGGNYFRQFPHTVVKRLVHHWHRTYTAPFVMYFHTWELDLEQPKIQAPLLQRIRQYRRLDRMPTILRHYLGAYPFSSIAEYLGLSTELRERPAAVSRPTRDEPTARAVLAAVSTTPQTPVTVVIPCFNEELILPYLGNTLSSVEEQLRVRYDLTFLFVDDASTDGTWNALQRLFGDRRNFRFVRHTENGGVAAAIMTGIRAAETEVVCSIDCDCTYDPHTLADMIPLLAEDVDLVTASPYHPQGGVRNVPNWRLGLSRSLSALYRRVLRAKLYTYTSCFRVYRRSAAADVRLQRTGFLGVAEMLGRMDMAGHKIVEFPTLLEVRMLGRSKMKILRTILGQLGLLAEFAGIRLSGRAAPMIRREPQIPTPTRASSLAAHANSDTPSGPAAHV